MPPAPGTYEVSVMLDENAFDAADSYLHVRGSPFSVTFTDTWTEPTLSGNAPSAKDRLSVWSKGKKVIVVPVEKPAEEEEEEEEEEELDPDDAPEAAAPPPAAGDSPAAEAAAPAAEATAGGEASAPAAAGGRQR